MDDLDLTKAIPAEVAKAAYNDTISPALKETGKIGTGRAKILSYALVATGLAMAGASVVRAPF
ncbi:hypothetical protein bAD24_p00945 (plasmid) [Burkholderia sp. AD24]|nr:hypothetical protein bAD24_p00945 [Burkholderia sp. AD24]